MMSWSSEGRTAANEGWAQEVNSGHAHLSGSKGLKLEFNDTKAWKKRTSGAARRSSDERMRAPRRGGRGTALTVPADLSGANRHTHREFREAPPATRRTSAAGRTADIRSRSAERGSGI
ncbi:hypothetical protein FQA47_007233 [Oryzias melastigma]|uniref:Uncharacterized protein n=1 Tax=Oryzias melastigma TaxID=30732 RepID=A0A834BPU5_ORYME|nr:hypothetical protein FQA47_007233 [Oryzias melastigma]